MARQLPCGWMNLSPPSGRRLRPHSTAARIALGLLVALGVFVWAFDWNWCRPLLRHYVMSHSGRNLQFDDLQVHWRHGLDPTIEFRGLSIQNAPWAASKAPFIQAGRLSAEISWRSVGSHLLVVNLVEMEDAQVDMERRADGVRNWRLSHPDDTGPPHARVLALDARRSRLHAIQQGIGLELDVSTTPLPAAEPVAHHPELPLTRLLVFKGQFRDDPFDGEARVSDVLAFGATPMQFALRAVARSGALQLDAAGLSNDVHALGDLDCDIKLSATGTGSYRPLPAALARLRPLVAQGHVTKSGDAWTGSAVRLHAGRQTSLVAEVAFTGNMKSQVSRRTLKATLHDAVIDVDDLLPPSGDKPAVRSKAEDARALSTKPLDLARLRDVDADVELKDARFTGTRRGMAQTLRAHATLANGVARLQTLDFGAAGGHVTGTLQLDASQTPASLAVDLDARGLRIEQLSPKLASDGALIGAVDARAVLKSSGDSSRAFARTASGDITISLAGGATVSRRLDAKLGLDGGEWLRTLFDKSARVPVQCGAVTLALDHGVATSRRFQFETSDTALAGRGSLDLANETVDATLTPAHKKLALLSLDKAIHAQGPWHDVKISLQPPSDAVPLRCTANPSMNPGSGSPG